jgi:dihydrofolate reductase
MSKLRVHNFSISLDGYGAGPSQDVNNPLGRGGAALHEWLIRTKTLQQRFGGNDGATGVDDDFVARGFENIGAWILGRNMFGPIRGDWPDESWRGWWGDDPPYHTEVFVLTHHARAPIEMDGGTTFRFVTEGIHAALEKAKSAAGDKDVRLGGGVSAIRQYLQARLIDELHIAISPIVLGRGEHLLSGIDTPALGYVCSTHAATPKATHFVLSRQE